MVRIYYNTLVVTLSVFLSQKYANTTRRIYQKHCTKFANIPINTYILAFIFFHFVTMAEVLMTSIPQSLKSCSFNNKKILINPSQIEFGQYYKYPLNIKIINFSYFYNFRRNLSYLFFYSSSEVGRVSQLIYRDCAFDC